MTKPPFPFPPPELFEQFAAALPPPPDWLRAELQNRLVLFLNHVLMQEPQAMERLRRQKGKVLQAQWGRLSLSLQATPAGLLGIAPGNPTPDLRVTLTEASPVALAQTLTSGEKPAVDIQGDVQFAADIAWLVDNIRWDVEEDLSRFVGDAAAHTLVEGAKNALVRLRTFAAGAAAQAQDLRAKVGAWAPGGKSDAGPPSAPERSGADQ